jgi:hypothetical protein
MGIHQKLLIGSGIGTIPQQQKELPPSNLKANECFSNLL